MASFPKVGFSTPAALPRPPSSMDSELMKFLTDLVRSVEQNNFAFPSMSSFVHLLSKNIFTYKNEDIGFIFNAAYDIKLDQFNRIDTSEYAFWIDINTTHSTDSSTGGLALYYAPPASNPIAAIGETNGWTKIVIFRDTGIIDGRLRDFTSVKDYGATGDGVTDDTDAINAALAANDKVYLPAGTYITSDVLLYGINTQLAGDGHQSSIISGTHTGNVLGPADNEARHRGLLFEHFAIVKSANTGTGNGLYWSNTKDSQINQIQITQCNIGFLFQPEDDANFSYHNEIKWLLSFSNTTSAVKTDATGTDYPNANTFIGGTWRGGTTTCDLVQGGGIRLLDTSIEGSTTDWLRIRPGADGTLLIGCRFENGSGSDLLTGGVRIEASSVQVLGGTSTKGQILPYRDKSGSETLIIGHKASGDSVFFGTSPYAMDHENGKSEWGSWGGIGLHQNYLTRSNIFSNGTSWPVSGTLTPTTGQTDRFGGTGATRFVTGSTSPSRSQTTSLNCAGVTVCASVWLRADIEGTLQFSIRESGSSFSNGTDEILRDVWISTEWRRHWIWHTFDGATAGTVVFGFRSQAGDLDEFYIHQGLLNDGKYPGIYVETVGSASTSSNVKLSIGTGTSGQNPPADFTKGGVATLVKAGAITDGDFENAFDGLTGIDSINGRFYFRYGGAWHYCTQDA